jgi:hypothetical protein
MDENDNTSLNTSTDEEMEIDPVVAEKLTELKSSNPTGRRRNGFCINQEEIEEKKFSYMNLN